MRDCKSYPLGTDTAATVGFAARTVSRYGSTWTLGFKASEKRPVDSRLRGNDGDKRE